MRLLPAIIHFTKLLLGAICSLLIGLLILGVLVFIFGMLQNSFWEKELTLKPMRESGSLSDLSTSFVDMSRLPFEIRLLHALLIVGHLPENDLWHVSESKRRYDRISVSTIDGRIVLKNNYHLLPRILVSVLS